MIATVAPIVLLLKEHRERAGLTQAELADAVGVRQATISDLESGKSQRIDFDLLERLADRLTPKGRRPLEPGDLLKRAAEPPERRGRGRPRKETP